MRRRVTYSRNLTLSLSRTCQCFCKYCAFATHRAHLHAPHEVEALIDRTARRGVKELLVLTGERPEVNAEVRERLAGYGHADFTTDCAQELTVGPLTADSVVVPPQRIYLGAGEIRPENNPLTIRRHDT